MYTYENTYDNHKTIKRQSTGTERQSKTRKYFQKTIKQNPQNIKKNNGEQYNK